MRPTTMGAASSEKAISWIESNSREPPVNCADLKEKLEQSYESQEPLALFTPWGPKYTYKEKGVEVGEPEIRTLKELEGIMSYFRQELGIPVKWYIMLADTYGTEINGLPEDAVNAYFSNLEKEIQKMPYFDALWWSRTKACDRYTELESQIRSRFFDYVSPEIFEKNIGKSRKFGGDVSNATAYSVERLVEGLLIEEMYAPLKISLVASKNDVLDGPLRRIYVVENRKPWLK